MTIPIERSPLSVQSEWLETVVAHCQRFVGTATLPGESHSIPELASAFVEALPDIRSPVEDLALRTLLAAVAVNWSQYLHDHAHNRSTTRRCSFVPSQSVAKLVGDSGPGARDRFLEWAHAFSVDFSRSHPVPAARRAAAIIDARHGEQSDAVTLARQIGVSPRQLRREFRRTFRVSLAKYVRHIRLTHALELMMEQPGKIEPVALVVGYKSKKNFYRVFKQTIGMTPTAFLRLPPAAARHVPAAARAVA